MRLSIKEIRQQKSVFGCVGGGGGSGGGGWDGRGGVGHNSKKSVSNRNLLPTILCNCKTNKICQNQQAEFWRFLFT